MLRRTLKLAMESILGSRLASTAATPLRSRRRLILAYHDVSEFSGAPPGDRSLHLPLLSFRKQLDEIERVGLPIIALAESDSVSAPHVVLTFDDACFGAVRHGMVELASRGVPATVFVAPGLLGCPSPWWDRLADPVSGEIPAASRQEALIRHRGRHDEVLRGADESRWPIQPPTTECRIATAADIATALRTHPGLTLGAHSWGHPNLSALSGVELEAELLKPLEWLRRQWPDRTIPWLAYPYGLQTPQVRSAAGTAGYSGALLVSGGWHRHHAPRDVFGTPRLNVSSGLSLRGFRVRLAGLLSS